MPVLALMDKYYDVPMSLAHAYLVRMTETLPDVQLLEEARPGRVRSAVRRSVVQRGRLVDLAIMATFTVAAIYVMSNLWSDLQSAGLLDPHNPAIVGRAPTLAEIEPGKPVWVISYSADAVRRTLVLDAAPGTPAGALVTHLADLAWLPR